MALVHVLKNTPQEVCLKCYQTNPNGGTITIGLDSEYIELPNEQFVGAESQVTIKELHWGVKPNKHIDVNRWNPDQNDWHGHYYFVGAGSTVFNGFVDNSYANGAIRIVADGEMHLTLKLSKMGYS